MCEVQLRAQTARRAPSKTGKIRNGLSEYRKTKPGEAEMDGIWEQG